MKKQFLIFVALSQFLFLSCRKVVMNESYDDGGFKEKPKADFVIFTNIDSISGLLVNNSIDYEEIEWHVQGFINSSELVVPFNFDSSGTFEIQLIAKNNIGVDTTKQEVSINIQKKLLFSNNVEIEDYCKCGSSNIHFNLVNYLSSGNTYSWNFGNPSSGASNFSSLSNPYHFFENPFHYQVYLKIIGDIGQISYFDSEYIDIYDLPEPIFTGYPLVANYLNANISFFNQSNNFIETTWFFGDGQISIVENPTHQYNKVGEFPVILVVKSEAGCYDYSIQTVEIQY